MEFNVWTVITVAVILGCMIPILGILASMQEKKIQARGASEDLEAKLDSTRTALGAASVTQSGSSLCLRARMRALSNSGINMYGLPLSGLKRSTMAHI